MRKYENKKTGKNPRFVKIKNQPLKTLIVKSRYLVV